MIEEPAVLVVGWTTTVFDRVSGLDRSLENTWFHERAGHNVEPTKETNDRYLFADANR